MNALVALLVLGAIGAPLDSQVVLDRYDAAVAMLVPPKAMIFTYTVSQAGPTDLEQTHRIYRSGIDVRDETIAANGASLHRKRVRISRRQDPYAVQLLAPRPASYEMVFLDTVRDGDHLDYVYQTQPLTHASTGFVVDRLTIDGDSFLPRVIEFHTTGATASGTGRIEFASVGGYWVPQAASVSAVVGGNIARERIVFSDYRFPPALPRSTFL